MVTKAEQLKQIEVPLDQIDATITEKQEYDAICATILEQIREANYKLKDWGLIGTHVRIRKTPGTFLEGLLLRAAVPSNLGPSASGRSNLHTAFIIGPKGIFHNRDANIRIHHSIFENQGRPCSPEQLEYLHGFIEYEFPVDQLQQAINKSIEMVKPKTPKVDLSQVTAKL